MLSLDETLKEFGFPFAVLEKEEIKLLLNHLENQYINYNNEPLHKLLREMRQWLSDNGDKT